MGPRVLRGLGLEKTLARAFSAEDEVLGKPHPAVFLTTSRHLSVPAEQCIAFEDSAAGLRAAMDAGMFTVAVPRGADTLDPVFQTADLVLHSLEEFRWPIARR